MTDVDEFVERCRSAYQSEQEARAKGKLDAVLERLDAERSHSEMIDDYVGGW